VRRLSPCWSKSWSLSGGFIRLRSLPVRAVSESRNGEGNLIELQTIGSHCENSPRKISDAAGRSRQVLPQGECWHQW